MIHHHNTIVPQLKEEKMRKKFIIISVCFLLLFFSACQEKTEREWYCKEANVKLKICVNDSCDVFIINDEDSVFTEHNRIYYQGYYLHLLEYYYFLEHYFSYFLLLLKEK